MSIAVGIDLGTTNSVISYINNLNKPIIIPNKEGSKITPSVICFKDNEIIVGDEAKELQELGIYDIAAFFKRQMGDETFTFFANSKEYTSTELSEIILKKMKNNAENYLGNSIKKAVITVPAYFKEKERQATIEAGKKAGFDVLQIINEPTAAAISYGINTNKNQKILVYDLGGGTFDITVLEITNNEIKILNSEGDHQLGGKDWDDRLISYISNKFEEEFGVDPLEDSESIADLLVRVEEAKKKLSRLQTTNISISYDGMKGRYEITRDLFEELTSDLMERTISLTQQTLDEINLSFNDINEILLVGGSTRMPMVHSFIKNRFNKEPLIGVNVDEAVSIGAAILAKEISENRQDKKQSQIFLGSRKLSEVTNHTLGMIAISEDNRRYKNSFILKKNTEIPCFSKKKKFQHITSKKNNKLEIFLTQGESENPNEVSYLGLYVVENIPKNKEIVEIEIQYQYDTNGVVHIKAYLNNNELLVKKFSLPNDIPNRFMTKPKITEINVPYTQYIGLNKINAKKDIYGNVKGNNYDLAKDGAFKNVQIAVLHLYYGKEGFYFKKPLKALKEKGFRIKHWKNNPPSLSEFINVLNNSSQLWIISDCIKKLDNSYIKVINKFFNEGHGLYIWGDNEPYYTDANYVAKNILGVSLYGNVFGDKTLSLQKEKYSPGLRPNHPITTGIEYLYEGITIATISDKNEILEPLLYGSESNLVIGIYDKDGKRAIVDGGFTRLFVNWDTAGTGRYVKNSAAWLTNYEKFGNEIFMNNL